MERFRSAAGLCRVCPSAGGRSGVRAEGRQLPALSFGCAAGVRSTQAREFRFTFMGLLSQALPDSLSSQYFLVPFPGSPVFRLAANRLLPKLSCLGPALGEQRERVRAAASFCWMLWPPLSGLGYGAERTREQGGKFLRGFLCSL